MKTTAVLRSQYPTISFDAIEWRVTDNALHITFRYSTPPDHSFTHTLTLHNVTQHDVVAIPPSELHSLLASLGLVELLSYWKSTVSPVIDVRVAYLDDWQVAWWHSLLLHGMGEFFFVNQIDPNEKDFVQIVSNTDAMPLSLHSDATVDLGAGGVPPKPHTALIPIGGGKDSVVTLTQLQNLYADQAQQSLGSVAINPTQATKDIIALSNLSKHFVIDRILDPTVLRLNQEGYRNGHVPFSASVAFLTTLLARLKDFDAIALSNERSANEGNTTLFGQEINHQYSKSFHFETAFQEYAHRTLSSKNTIPPYYFSLLRPLYELQIGMLFAHQERFHPVFRSCNRGQKTNTWCQDCPKCLFAFIILFPFLEQSDIENYFGSNLFENKKLITTAVDLTGYGKNKPLECVGLYEESIISFWLAVRVYQENKKNLPVVLQKVQQRVLLHEKKLPERAKALITGWNTEHAVPINLAENLQNQLAVDIPSARESLGI